MDFMAEVKGLVISLTILSLHTACVFPKPSRYYMEERCGMTLPVTEPSVWLVLRRTFYNTHLDCFLTLEAENVSSTYQTHFMIVFHKLDIQRHTLHCRHFLEVKDGNSRDSPSVRGLKAKYCGDEFRPDGAYVTSGSELSLRFFSDDTGDDDDFEIIITPFHRGPCNASEIVCKDGGECISSENKCDGFNNCGDGSDECYEEINYATVIIVLSIFGVMVVTVIAFCFHRKRIQRGRVVKYPKTQNPTEFIALQPVPPQPNNSGDPMGQIHRPPHNYNVSSAHPGYMPVPPNPTQM